MDIFELSVHCQNKANLVMMEIFFDICLYLVWKYLTEDFFCICVYQDIVQ